LWIWFGVAKSPVNPTGILQVFMYFGSHMNMCSCWSVFSFCQCHKVIAWFFMWLPDKTVDIDNFSTTKLVIVTEQPDQRQWNERRNEECFPADWQVHHPYLLFCYWHWSSPFYFGSYLLHRAEATMKYLWVLFAVSRLNTNHCNLSNAIALCHQVDAFQMQQWSMLHGNADSLPARWGVTTFQLRTTPAARSEYTFCGSL